MPAGNNGVTALSASPMGPDDGISSFAVPPGELHVWIIRLDEPEPDEDGLRKFVIQEEYIRAKKFASIQLRRRYLVAHAALRIILGRALGLAPLDVAIRPDSNGKPRVAHNPEKLFFNLSHSGDLALVALSSHADVGIDLEQCRPRLRLTELVERYFSDVEKKALEKLADGDQDRGFYCWWTYKEACLKATGLGLRYPLDAFSIEFRPGYVPRILKATGKMAALRLIALVLDEPGYQGAAAIVDSISPTVIMRRWSWTSA